MMLIALLMLAAASAAIAFISLRPDKFRIARTAVIDAPPEAVYREVNDFHNWERWSPWAKLDPNQKIAYDGSPLGAGAIFSWSGDKRVGAGKMKIVESSQNERVRIKIAFQKPIQAINDVQFDLKPLGDQEEAAQTEVTWSMSGRHDFIGKAMNVFMNMDKMVGAQFEQGLANLNEAVSRKQIAAQ